MTKILAIGESLFDYFPNQKILGGAPLNFAVHGVQLGADVSLLTRVGEDDLGEEIVDTLAMRSIDIQYIQYDREKATGKVDITFTDEQQSNPDYHIVEDVAWDYLEFYPHFSEEFSDFDCIYFGTLAQRNEASRKTIYEILKNFSGFKLLDLNLRKPYLDLDLILQSIQLADGLKLNLDEAQYLQDNLNCSDNYSDWLTEYNLKWLVITKGELGTTWIDRNGIFSGDQVAVEPQENADSVGAGDAVCAMLITQYLGGHSPDTIVKKANEIGAYVASCAGATPFLPLQLCF